MTDEAVRLVEELRTLRADNGLTLTELGRRTHFSKSSWERWLNGHRLPTREAVEGLLTAVGAHNREQVLRLWERADAAESGECAESGESGDATSLDEGEPAVAVAPPTDHQHDPATDPDGPAKPPRRYTRWTVAFLACAASAAAVAFLGSDSSGHSHSPVAARTSPTAESTHAAASPTCRAAGCTGQDPQAAGCGADARTVAMSAIAGAYIYVRYSPACEAAWARMTDAAAGDTIQILDPGHKQEYRIHYGRDGFSPMLDASHNDWVRACSMTPQGSACGDVITDPSQAAPLAGDKPVSPAASTVPSSVSASAKPHS